MNPVYRHPSANKNLISISVGEQRCLKAVALSQHLRKRAGIIHRRRQLIQKLVVAVADNQGVVGGDTATNSASPRSLTQ